ncbi:rhomboid family intramembrane serine protease [Draconibacterium sp. IB214405]|uniref:rhomboid family intramembrane serine protease n=1 Tax=Draconibacterium sp. IB214405 TaxID=3097352 RepID=UPI002A14E009|nr:rhomboid family intramembrane serine protease [Draconibacterium sp. IB214405]MDX8341505.1 rhomboid family intramembrane serine protease [Draconibacterium sp. IB214405]
MDIVGDIKRTFKEGSVLSRLIYINIGVFLLLKIIGVFFYLSGQNVSLYQYLSVPSITEVLVQRPWTPITYMFLHQGFIHLLFNMLGLYWFGQLFLYHFEGNKLLSVYLMGGLWGAFLYIIAYNFIPVFDSAYGLLLGASASIFAILVAVAFYDPNREIHLFFIGRFPLKYVAAFYVLLSVIGISSSNPGGNIAHLGGAFWGWFYIYQLRKGKDMGAGLVKLLDKLGEFLSGLFKPKSKMKITYKKPPRDDHEYNRQKHVQQDEINRILDKIAKSGYDSLSKKEKELLFKQGKK